MQHPSSTSENRKTESKPHKGTQSHEGGTLETGGDRESVTSTFEASLNHLRKDFDDLRTFLGAMLRPGSLKDEAGHAESDLLQRFDDARYQLHGLKTASTDAFEDLRSGVEAAWKDLREGLQNAKTRFRNDQPGMH